MILVLPVLPLILLVAFRYKSIWNGRVHADLNTEYSLTLTTPSNNDILDLTIFQSGLGVFRIRVVSKKNHFFRFLSPYVIVRFLFPPHQKYDVTCCSDPASQ